MSRKDFQGGNLSKRISARRATTTTAIATSTRDGRPAAPLSLNDVVGHFVLHKVDLIFDSRSARELPVELAGERPWASEKNRDSV